MIAAATLALLAAVALWVADCWRWRANHRRIVASQKPRFRRLGWSVNAVVEDQRQRRKEQR